MPVYKGITGGQGDIFIGTPKAGIFIGFPTLTPLLYFHGVNIFMTTDVKIPPIDYTGIFFSVNDNFDENGIRDFVALRIS